MIFITQNNSIFCLTPQFAIEVPDMRDPKVTRLSLSGADASWSYEVNNDTKVEWEEKDSFVTEVLIDDCIYLTLISLTDDVRKIRKDIGAHFERKIDSFTFDQELKDFEDGTIH